MDGVILRQQLPTCLQRGDPTHMTCSPKARALRMPTCSLIGMVTEEMASSSSEIGKN